MCVYRHVLCGATRSLSCTRSFWGSELNASALATLEPYAELAPHCALGTELEVLAHAGPKLVAIRRFALATALETPLGKHLSSLNLLDFSGEGIVQR